MPDDVEHNKQLVRSFFETLSTGDLERVAGFFDERSVWEMPWVTQDVKGAGTHVGRKGIIDEFLAPVRGMFEPGDPKVEIQNMVAEGSWVTVEATGRGRFRNGTPYENFYAFVIEIDGDTIRTLREYMDSYYASTVNLP